MKRTVYSLKLLKTDHRGTIIKWVNVGKMGETLILNKMNEYLL